VELSFTPYAHPIMPLLLDIETAREAMPDVILPEQQSYPEGEARVRWHIERGLAVFKKHFGFSPKGCWPSEGGISTDTLKLLDEYGLPGRRVGRPCSRTPWRPCPMPRRVPATAGCTGRIAWRTPAC
jgi:peptidoglycan/xylan/chitin deacetylase (PgdA/CDA1 family)